MYKINKEKLEKFIEENTEREMTRQDLEKDLLRLKHSILEQAERNLKFAFERENSTMVAAIAEILKAN